MKRAIALIVTLAIMFSAFSTLAYAQMPNCATHDPYLLLALGWGVEKDVSTRYEYEMIDGTKHLKKSIISISCATCGEFLTDMTKESTEEYHSFNPNSLCILCGYQSNYFWPSTEPVSRCTNCESTEHSAENCPYCEYCRHHKDYGHAGNCPNGSNSRYYDCTEVLNQVFNDAANQAKWHKMQSPQNMTYLLDYMTAADDEAEFLYNLFGYIPGPYDFYKLYLSKDDAINLAWFVSKVDDDEEWDIKEKIPWETTVGTTWPGDNKSVAFYGKLYTISDLGNLLYGYAGTAMGIPEEVLCFGGGFVVNHWEAFVIGPPYYGDDVIDTPMIKEGVNWYNREH